MNLVRGSDHKVDGDTIFDSLTLNRLVIFQNLPSKDETLAFHRSLRSHHFGNLFLQLEVNVWSMCTQKTYKHIIITLIKQQACGNGSVPYAGYRSILHASKVLSASLYFSKEYS